MFLGVKLGWHVRLTNSPPSRFRLPRKYGNIDSSQYYRPLQPVTKNSLLLTYVIFNSNVIGREIRKVEDRLYGFASCAE
jgi:hypothetical protein